MSPRAQLLQRFEVLAVTAAPGGQRLLHFALVHAVCGTEALGRFANDLSIAMMLGLFSAVGWSALVLARVPVAARSAPVMLGLARGAGLFTLLACLSLPLLADNSDLALGIVPTEPVIEFVGWETAEEGGEAAALVRLTMGLKSEAESGNFLRSFLSGEQTVTARLVPGDFPLSHAVELRATLRTEAGAEDTFGLAGRVEIETTGQVYFGRTASLQLPSVDPLQAGDMVETMADTSRAKAAFGFEPGITIEQGLPEVVAWCRAYFGDKA